ncbi:hypothetical protein LXL04_023744 [Taraxacum kok-saghyz]
MPRFLVAPSNRPTHLNNTSRTPSCFFISAEDPPKNSAKALASPFIPKTSGFSLIKQLVTAHITPKYIVNSPLKQPIILDAVEFFLVISLVGFSVHRQNTVSDDLNSFQRALVASRSLVLLPAFTSDPCGDCHRRSRNHRPLLFLFPIPQLASLFFRPPNPHRRATAVKALRQQSSSYCFQEEANDAPCGLSTPLASKRKLSTPLEELSTPLASKRKLSTPLRRAVHAPEAIYAPKEGCSRPKANEAPWRTDDAPCGLFVTSCTPFAMSGKGKGKKHGVFTNDEDSHCLHAQ